MVNGRCGLMWHSKKGKEKHFSTLEGLLGLEWSFKAFPQDLPGQNHIILMQIHEDSLGSDAKSNENEISLFQLGSC